MMKITPKREAWKGLQPMNTGDVFRDQDLKIWTCLNTFDGMATLQNTEGNVRLIPLPAVELPDFKSKYKFMWNEGVEGVVQSSKSA